MRSRLGLVILVAANVGVAVFSLTGSAWLWARASEPLMYPEAIAVPALPAVVDEVSVPLRREALRPVRAKPRQAARPQRLTKAGKAAPRPRARLIRVRVVERPARRSSVSRAQRAGRGLRPKGRPGRAARERPKGKRPAAPKRKPAPKRPPGKAPTSPPPPPPIAPLPPVQVSPPAPQPPPWRSEDGEEDDDEDRGDHDDDDDDDDGDDDDDRRHDDDDDDDRDGDDREGDDRDEDDRKGDDRD
jgi:hypothetical protein